jgi:hypothetical protein
MSHYTRIRTALADAVLLAEALRAEGFAEVEVHDGPQPLYDYRGEVRPEQAEVIVRRRLIGPASNDLGFARRPDGTFDVVVSTYDRRRYDSTWLARLARGYGYAATLRYAADHGFDVATDEVEQDGTRRLTLRRTR